VASALQGIVDHHGADFAGIGLVCLAVLAALGVWFDAAGPAGSAADKATRVLFGDGAVVVPIVLLAAGVGLVLDRRARIAVRGILGGALVFWAVLGMRHLAAGTPPLSSQPDVLAASGGVFGAVLAVPLQAAVGGAGATVVCLALLATGLLIATGTRLHTLGTHMVRLGKWLFVHPEDGAGPPVSLPGPTIDLTDLDTEDGATTADAPAAAPDTDGAGAETRTQDRAVPDAQDTPKVAPAKAPRKPKQLRLEPPRPPDAERYELPSLDLLRRSGQSAVDHTRLEERSEVIARTLAQFKVGARVVGIVAGPTVTRFEIELEEGVKVNMFTKLVPDLRYALATPDVRVLTPIPGRSAIGLEVPNADRKLVTVGDILTSPEAHEATHPLQVALGRDISGTAVFVNLAKMPHLLIAGATGAGKSSVINSMMTSLLYRTRPSEVRMILIDPKRVELTRYARVPHLLTGVVTQPKRAADALTWAVQEMDRRYGLLEAVGMRDIDGYNEAVVRGELPPFADGSSAERLPYIVVVVDELADLMLVAAKAVEDSICRLAQLARAVGLHLVIATQRPSVDVITGLIKANIPSRIALKTRSLIDSRTILDDSGAETLVGLGDLLYLGGNATQPERIQGAFVSEAEVRDVVHHWREQVRASGGAAPMPTAVPVHTGADAPAGTADDTPFDQEAGVGIPGPVAVGTAAEVAQAPPAVQTAVASAIPGPAAPAAASPPSDEIDVVFSGETAVQPAVDDGDSDPLLAEAMDLVVTSQLGSTSMLQRKLRVGFSRAGRIMDLLERKGVVGPSEGSKARAVLIAPHELDAAKARISQG